MSCSSLAAKLAHEEPRSLYSWVSNPLHSTQIAIKAVECAEFIAFLNQLLSKARWAKQIHIVLDNLSAHKTQAVEEFLARHPKVHFHFTPTYSSWLNQVELWLAKIQRDVIRRGVFTSVADLARKLRKYIAVYAKSARPFRWTYTDPRKRIHINEITGTPY